MMRDEAGSDIDHSESCADQWRWQARMWNHEACRWLGVIWSSDKKAILREGDEEDTPVFHADCGDLCWRWILPAAGEREESGRGKPQAESRTRGMVEVGNRPQRAPKGSELRTFHGARWRRGQQRQA